jgi:hypothetical protein
MVGIEEYKRAERELMLAESRRAWTIHATIYAAVNTGLTLLNVLLVVFTDATFFWFPFPLVCWGIGVAMHHRYGVRFAEREIEARQREVAQRAEQLRPAA